jgi:hypothetical protein
VISLGFRRFWISVGHPKGDRPPGAESKSQQQRIPRLPMAGSTSANLIGLPPSWGRAGYAPQYAIAAILRSNVELLGEHEPLPVPVPLAWGCHITRSASSCSFARSPRLARAL